MLSLFGGSNVRWQDAYAALDATEMNLPRDPAQRERLLHANAQADSEPPLGLQDASQIHQQGTLARLHLIQLDDERCSVGTPK